MNEAKTIERAIETVFLNSGQNIDDLPSVSRMFELLLIMLADVS